MDFVSFCDYWCSGEFQEFDVADSVLLLLLSELRKFRAVVIDKAISRANYIIH